MCKICIIHIVLDEKFIDCAIDQFNSIKNLHNRYIFFRPIKCLNLQYIHHKDKIEYFSNWKALRNELCNTCYDILCLHSLAIDSYTLFRIPKKIKIVWLSWGWDIYQDCSVNLFSDLPIKISLFKPLTRNYIKTDYKFILRRMLISVYFFYRRKIIYKEMIKRIDYCSTVLSNEMDLLYSNSYFRAKPFYFRYGDKHSEVNNPYDLTGIFNGTNILIGNSATIENNHLDIISIFDRMKLNKRKIVLPLSYGDKEYVKVVENKINKKQHEYVILRNFMPLNEYKQIINSCSHVIMGHIRQQAIGNVFLALISGCKLFLYKNSIAYNYLINEGYYVYTIDDDLNEKELSFNLKDEEIIHNRLLASERTSMKKMKHRLELSIMNVINNI